MTLASSRGAFGATAIAAVQVISLVLGEEDDFEDTTMMYYCVLSIRGRERERERERDFLRVVDNTKCVLSKSDDDKYIRANPKLVYASRKMAVKIHCSFLCVLYHSGGVFRVL